MDAEVFLDHLEHPRNLGALPDAKHRGSAGGAACGDVVDFRVELDASGVVSAGFDADGCGALTAAASAAVELIDSKGILDAAKVSTEAISAELGGLSAAKLHAAELVCDAMHRALGEAARCAQLPAADSRVAVAMSGGVDSALAASLCADDSEVVAMTLELWRDSQTDAAASCCSHVAVRRARSVAHSAGLAHFTLDLREEFRRGVVDPWLAGHSAGSTPNPCVQCNGRVRIEPMADLALRLGAHSLATGHYAQLIEQDNEAGPLLAAGVDAGKDQAYALARVPASVLSMMRFPLGAMTKPAVRAEAKRRQISVADAPDSQDLCFIAGVGREGFLRQHGGLANVSGPIVDASGAQIGSHRGHFNHTVGQRRGLSVGGGTPLYVTKVDAASNTVHVGPRSALGTRTVRINDLDLRRGPDRVMAARLRHRAAPGRVASFELVEGGALIHFEEAVDMVAPGQVACLLDGETVIGCGTVSSVGA